MRTSILSIAVAVITLSALAACESDEGLSEVGTECQVFLETVCERASACDENLSMKACMSAMEAGLPGGGCKDADSIRDAVELDSCKAQIASWDCAELTQRLNAPDLPAECENQIIFEGD